MTLIDLDSRLSIPPHVMSRPVGDETVLLDLQSGRYFGLDSVGKRIWEAVSDGRTLAETADRIVEEYDIGEDEARSDVINFASKLVERGLLAHGLPGE